MKNYQFKWLLLSIILSLASITTAGAYTYTPTGVGQQAAQTQQTMQSQQPAIQSHQMMHGGSTYQGQVYTPFSGEVPSSQSSPARISGPRRGYNPETGEWTPDAPDIETAGDTGNSNESPIGEPGVMLLMALAFGGVIMVRQMRKKFITPENNTQNENTMKGQKFIAILVMLLTFGVGQMWGDSGFFSKGQWQMVYNAGGADQNTGYQDNGATVTLSGYYTTLRLLGCNVKTWGDVNTKLDWWKSFSSSLSPRNDGAGNFWYINVDYNGDHDNWLDCTDYDLIANAPNQAGENTLYMAWALRGYNTQTGVAKVKFTIPGFTTTSTSQSFSSTEVNGESSTIKISFGNHYGTALTTGNCSSLTDFTVTAIDETGVTVKFTPKSAGSKSETLTITDAHGKTCSITLTGKTKVLVTYQAGTYGSGSNQIADKVYGENLSLANRGHFTRAGYTQTAWNTNTAGTGGTSYALNGTYSTDAAITLYPTWSPTQYTITFDKQSGSDGTNSATVHYTQNDFSVSPVVAPTRTGYTFGGYYSETNGNGEKIVNADGTWVDPASEGTYLDASGNWNYAGNLTVYAKWTPISYTVVFNGNGSTSGSMANQGFTYDVAQSLTANVYEKDGYYMTGWATTVEGAKVYDDGQSVSNLRNTSGNFNLYAKWAKSELTNLTFTPSSPAPEGDVAITPVFDHEPTGTTVICYELHSNSTATAEVPGTTFAEGGDSKVHFNAPSASGTYYVKATFRAGGSCSGTVLNTIVVPIVISSDHTVTVRYMCDGVAIHESSEVVVPAGGTLAITALTGDDVFGYSFDSWALGDGINQESVDGGTITISAFFNGVLTANYTKKGMILFKNTLGWSDVWVHFLGSSYWDSTEGTGNRNRENRNKHMTRLGETNIWYFDYGAADISPTGYEVFTDREYTGDGNGYGNFHGSSSLDKAPVVYPIVRDNSEDLPYGFNAGTPMFVPLKGQSGMEKTVDSDGNKKAMYYNKGYWRKYESSGKTGYTLEIYDKTNSDGRNLLYSIPLTEASDGSNLFEATIDLEAGKTYGVKFLRDNSWNYTHNGVSFSQDGSYIDFGKQADDWAACGLNTTVAGDYAFHLACGNDGILKLAVTFPAAAKDYRVVYRDANHNTDRKQRFSRTITKKANADDIVSFFIDKGNSESMKFQYISNISGSTVTWTDVTGGAINLSAFSDVITQDGVYNFHLHQDGSSNISVTKVEPYTGDFYIRTDAVGGTKWADYQNAAHVMAYSEYAKDNSGYSHYWMKHLNGEDNVNVKFVVANDYSAWVSDTVIQQSPEVAHIDANGKNTGDVSIRFSYNSATNEAKRTYLANSTASDFLVLKNNAGAGEFTDEDDVDKAKVDIKFVDHENYIYDIIAKVNPSAKVRIKVYAHYNTTDQPLIGTDATSTFTDANSKLLLNGTGSTLQTIRILYDFKTNRIVSAWQAAGTTTGKLEIDADLMIVREHQGAAQNIILEPYVEKDKPDVPGEIVTNKRIYAVMRFNRWILNNLDNPDDKEADHAHTDNYTTYHPALEPRYQLPIYERNLYYISFPFDVNVSDIFGFGTYGTHYAIQRYDGIGRAKNGYWVDSDPNWKWVPPTGKLNAYEGYVLSLSLSNMYVTNTNVWANNCSEVELYFPSAEEGFTIDTKDVTIEAINGEGSEYRCTINRGTSEGDRRFKDSYWRCIGVPSFANYETALTSDGSATINWQPASVDEDADGSIPFIYNINWNDKSLTAYEGSTFPFKAMHSYLVQYGGGIHWSNVVVSSPSPASVVARKRNENTSEHTYCLKLMQGDTFGDQTFVRMTDKEGVTSGFDFDQDLWKQKFANRANIYTFIGYEQVAGNSMPMSEQTTVVPVGVQIAADGEYTFSMPEGTNGVGVYLVDNIAGTRTNLALTDYTVNLTAGTYDERFILEISPIAQTPTDIDNVEGDNVQGTKVRKVMVDGILYIVKDGQVFDARGNRIQ